MAPNPFLKKLGYTNNDRLVIIHTDDIGMCQASVQAFKDLWAFGTVTSGAVMVPCAWFPAVVQMCRENPAMDMGVHATLNSEWDTYRWAPLLGGEAGSGLRDSAGYFYNDPDYTRKRASAQAVEQEMVLQVERALKAGIDVTHIDSHMGTVLHPQYVEAYVRVAGSRLLPNMLPRLDAQGVDMMGVGDAERVVYAPVAEMMEKKGVPFVNGIFGLPLEHDRDHIGLAKQMLGNLPVGITHFILHPSIDTPELRAICPDWRARVANYNAFMSDELKKFLEREGIRTIGYRAIRDAMRKG